MALCAKNITCTCTCAYCACLHRHARGTHVSCTAHMYTCLYMGSAHTCSLLPAPLPEQLPRTATLCPSVCFPVQVGGCHQTGAGSPCGLRLSAFTQGLNLRVGQGQQVRGRSGARRVLYFGCLSRLLPVIHHPGYLVPARSTLTSALSPMTPALLLPHQPRSSPLLPGPLPGVSPSKAVLFLGLPVPVSGFRAPPSLSHPIQLLKPNPTSSSEDGLDRLLLKPEHKAALRLCTSGGGGEGAAPMSRGAEGSEGGVESGDGGRQADSAVRRNSKIVPFPTSALQVYACRVLLPPPWF